MKYDLVKRRNRPSDFSNQHSVNECTWSIGWHNATGLKKKKMNNWLSLAIPSAGVSSSFPILFMHRSCDDSKWVTTEIIAFLSCLVAPIGISCLVQVETTFAPFLYRHMNWLDSELKKIFFKCSWQALEKFVLFFLWNEYSFRVCVCVRVLTWMCGERVYVCLLEECDNVQISLSLYIYIYVNVGICICV